MGANLLVLRDTSMNGALRVDGNTQLNRRLIVFGDVSFNSRLLVIGDVSMNSSVFIRDTTRVDGNTQINQRLNVVGDVSMGANLLVLRDSSLNGDFRLDGNAQMNQVLNVLGDVSMGSNLLVLGNATINRRAFILSDVSMGANLLVLGNATINRRAFILSDVSMGANLLVIGNTTLRKKTLAYDDITIARNGIIINELNNMNVIGEYTLDNISGSITADNYNSGALLWNNATNTYDATFNSPSSSNSTLQSGELSIFSKNTISANGLITNPFSFPGGATRVNVGMQLNMAANSNIWIMRMLFLQSDATTSAGSISFTISGAAQLLCVIGASQTTINLLNSLPTNTDFWLTISQQTASPYNLTIYLNGVSVYASNLPAFSLTSPARVRFVFGYNDTAVIPNSTRITYKRIVLDYDGDYTAPLSVYNTLNAYPSVFMPIKFSVQGNATINRNLFGLSDASFGGKLYAIGDASFGSKLYTIGDASFGSKLYVINDVSMGANLTIVGNTTINRRLYTIGDASFGSRLFAINDVSFGGKFYTIGDASFGANVRIMGNAQLDQPVIALSDVSMGSTLRVARDASFNANVRIVGNTIIDSTLAVNGNVSVNANLIVANDTQINGALSVAQRASFAQTIQMNNDLTINANAYINKNAFILLDASFGGNIYAADGSFNGNVFVNNNLTINKRLIGVDASFNNDINIKRNALVEGSLIIFGNVDVSKNTYILGDVSLNANLYVKRDQTNDGNLLVNNIVRSQYYESTSSTGNIFIGGLGLNPVGGGLAPKRNIFIGCNAEGTQQTQNTIRIGGGQDIVVLGGERGVTIENINAGKTFRLNNPATTTSEGAGIEIIDPDAGQTSSLKLAIGKGGFDFQVPTNRVKLDIQSLKLASASKAGFLSLTAIDPDNSYYSVGLGPFDVSNILLKRTTTTADVNDNIQVIDTNLGVLGNAYITRSLALGKTTAASGTILDIIGNVSVNNGFIWQF
jgi:UDP-3-O-[3-hydroxymyristoyl] glucosamine N-acyltransferase